MNKNRELKKIADRIIKELPSQKAEALLVLGIIMQELGAEVLRLAG